MQTYQGGADTKQILFANMPPDLRYLPKHNNQAAQMNSERNKFAAEKT